MSRIPLVALAAATATSLAAPPAAAGPVQGLSCGLRASRVHGGPAALTGELATLVTYRCVVVVRTPSATTTQTAAFDTSGPVAVLPPAPVSIPANAQRVTVCTEVEWYFGFPGGGLVDLGCRDAVTGPTGYELTPEVLT